MKEINLKDKIDSFRKRIFCDEPQEHEDKLKAQAGNPIFRVADVIVSISKITILDTTN